MQTWSNNIKKVFVYVSITWDRDKKIIFTQTHKKNLWPRTNNELTRKQLQKIRGENKMSISIFLFTVPTILQLYI